MAKCWEKKYVVKKFNIFENVKHYWTRKKVNKMTYILWELKNFYDLTEILNKHKFLRKN